MIITVPLTSEGWDDEDDLKNTHRLLSAHRGSSALQVTVTLRGFSWILENLQGMPSLSAFKRRENRLREIKFLS